MDKEGHEPVPPVIGNFDAGDNADWIKQLPGYWERVRAQLERRQRRWERDQDVDDGHGTTEGSPAGDKNEGS